MAFLAEYGFNMEYVELILNNGERLPWVVSDQEFSILKKFKLLFTEEAPYSAYFGDVIRGMDKVFAEVVALLAEAKEKGQIVVAKTPAATPKRRGSS